MQKYKSNIKNEFKIAKYISFQHFNFEKQEIIFYF
jgi:hypothetical protein